MTANDRVIAVTGATGRQGGAVARHLLSDGWRVRALTHDPDSAKARALATAGAEVVKADMDDRDTLSLPPSRAPTGCTASRFS
ncbi:NmrA family NAD(P)-binding protein [Actinokineospora sp.]|uniref:NmrA family NAD(P)-binding protein n=1 Tax=Actinokineospora sp. TaxID=1872133 RepID=UPI003D6A1DF1